MSWRKECSTPLKGSQAASALHSSFPSSAATNNLQREDRRESACAEEAHAPPHGRRRNCSTLDGIEFGSSRMCRAPRSYGDRSLWPPQLFDTHKLSREAQATPLNPRACAVILRPFPPPGFGRSLLAPPPYLRRGLPWPRREKPPSVRRVRENRLRGNGEKRCGAGWIMANLRRPTRRFLRMLVTSEVEREKAGRAGLT